MIKKNIILIPITGCAKPTIPTMHQYTSQPYNFININMGLP